MYKIALTDKELKKLYLLREYCGAGPIVRQVRNAVKDFIHKKESRMGTSIEDATEGIAKHTIEASQSCLVESRTNKINLI